MSAAPKREPRQDPRRILAVLPAPDYFAARCTRCGVRDDLDREQGCDEPGCGGRLIRSDDCTRCGEPMHNGDGPVDWVQESSEVVGVCDECVTPAEWRASHDDDRSED